MTHSERSSVTDGKLRTRMGPLLCFPNTGARMERERERESEDRTPATQTTLATKSRLANLGSSSWNLSKIFSTYEIKVKGTLNARWNCKIDLCLRMKILAIMLRGLLIDLDKSFG